MERAGFQAVEPSAIGRLGLCAAARGQAGFESGQETPGGGGYPEGGFTVTIYIISSYGWFQPREAQILQADLKKLGIESNIMDIPDAGPSTPP